MTVPFLDLGAAYRELKHDIDAAVARVLESGWYILGPEVEAFETAFAQYCAANHAIGVANGLDALIVSLRALGIEHGDEVIVPANTYIATWFAVSDLGAVPVPVDPNPATHNIDPEQIEAAITPATRAIIAVHLYGQPADLAPIAAIARQYRLALIEDAAQCVGACYRGTRIGAYGDAVCWSFYPGKNLGAMGDGGAVTTNNAALAATIRKFGNYGSDKKYVHQMQGINSRLDPLQAAVLHVKLRHLDEWTERRRRIAMHYLEGFSGLKGIILPHVPQWADPVWHLFVIRSPQRAALQAHLTDEGIATLIHYPTPPHRQGAYQTGWRTPTPLPIAERLAQEVLSLPIGPHMPPEDVARVIHAVKTFEHSV